MKRIALVFSLLMLLLGSFLTGCVQQPGSSGLKVVATTTIVGDIARQIGGERISLTVLLPVGADPHTYEPRPRDVAAIHDARVIFINGLELEHSLEPIISANSSGPVIAVSDGVTVLPFSATPGDAQHTAGDPHTWTDPNNVKIWVENIRQALTTVDPSGAELYKTNAETLTKDLTELDSWITQEVALISAANRKLVTDHQSMGYFTNRYGFEQAGLLLPSLTTNASASALDLAQVEEVINTQGIHTIFIEVGANDALAAQVANDTGVTVARIYSGSLGTADSGAGTYLDFMRFNVKAIVEGLRN